MDTRHYSDFLGRISANIGVDEGDLSTIELTLLLNLFNKGYKQAVQAMNWVDICPYGEVRFPTSLITYPNDLTQSAYWTNTNTTDAQYAATNPLDNRMTATALLESSATAPHGIQQTVTILPTQQYFASGYAQPNGRNWVQLSVYDGSSTFSCFFNLVGTGSVGTASTGANGVVSQLVNGWYNYGITFTSSASAGSGAYFSIGLSPDGSTTSYAGNTSLGVNLWGQTAYLSQNLPPAANVIPWNQLGESPIDVVFPNGVQVSSPLASSVPRLVGYKTTPNGIQIINNSWGWNQAYYPQGPLSPSTAMVSSATPVFPVYLNYRIRPNNYYGASYSAGTSYTNGQQFYYTNTAGYGDYYSVIGSPTAGTTPDAAPSSFTALTIPFVFFDYIINSVFADWLRTEGQFAKAQMVDAIAQDILDRESDRQERQMGNIMPWKVSTHLTSRPFAAR
jgi:hypothetical protein